MSDRRCGHAVCLGAGEAFESGSHFVGTHVLHLWAISCSVLGCRAACHLDHSGALDLLVLRGVVLSLQEGLEVVRGGEAIHCCLALHQDAESAR